MSGKSSEDPKVQMKMFRTSRLQKIVLVSQVQVIDEVTKVPRDEMQKVQISFSPGRTKCTQRPEIHDEQS